MAASFESSMLAMPVLDVQVLQSFYGSLSATETNDILQRFYHEASVYHQRLVKALAMKNMLDIMQMAHKLKSMTALTGAQQYSTLCVSIDRIMRDEALDELERLNELELLASYLPMVWQQLEQSIHSHSGLVD